MPARSDSGGGRARGREGWVGERAREDLALIIGRCCERRRTTSTRELSLPPSPSPQAAGVIGFATFAFADCLSLLAAREKTSRFSG